MILFNDSYWWLAVLAVVVLLVLTYFYYRRTIPPLKKPWRIGLGILRGIALLLLLLALTETLLSFSPEIPDPPIAVGLIDISESMTMADEDISGRARQIWENIADRLPPQVQDVRMFVAESLLAGEDIPDQAGRATALGTALDAVQQEFESKNLAAVFLFSDGNSNLGPEPARVAGGMKAPVITIGMGRPDTGLVPSVVAVGVDEVVLANRNFTITAAVTARQPGSVQLRLRGGAANTEDQTVEITAPGQRVETTFETSVPAAGIFDFRVEPVNAPEAGRSFFVKALKEKTRVLLFGSRPDWEFAYLRRTLESIPDYEIVPVLSGGAGKNLLEPPPIGEQEWRSYDAVILVNPEESWLRSTWAPVAEQMAAAGKGVMLLLGEHSFSRRAATLPYPLSFIEGRSLWTRGEFPTSVDAGSVRHPVLRLEENPEDSRQVFESFPPFAGAWDLRELPPQANLLLSYQPPGLDSRESRELPLMWTTRQGSGKALIVNGGPLWRWSFNSSVEPDGVDYYRRFLGFAVRWLTVIEDLEKQRIEADKEIYAAGEPIRLRGFLYDDGYRFLPRASIVARVWPDSVSEAADSAVVFLPPGGGDFYEATLTGLKPGLYNFAGRAVIDADTLEMAGGKLTVEFAGLESSARGLNELQMRTIADKSGGRYYPETDPVAVLDSLTFTSRTYTIHREIEVWNRPWLLVLFLVFIGGEWFFRKRKQLL